MKYITLKIELLNSDSKRTITVPAGLSLADLSEAIQCVMDWDDSHLWEFSDGDAVVYTDERSGDGWNRRERISATEVSVAHAFPVRGARLRYSYDFGDGWEHKVTRMADPKVEEIACLRTQGTDGIDDIGGVWGLASFIDDLKKGVEPGEDHCSWGYDTPEKRERFLKGPSVEELTKRLRDRIGDAELLPEEETATEIMSLDEQAHMLGLIFTFTVDSDTWGLLESAMKNAGKTDFEDETGEIREFLSTHFKGLKIKRARSGYCKYELTVLKEWVEMYKTHGKEWHASHAVMDALEAYASSAVYLYGVVTLDELKEIMLHYDKGYCLPDADLERLLTARALCPNMPFRLEGDCLLQDAFFPLDAEDSGASSEALLGIHERCSRWFPASREELFDWEYGPVYPGEDPKDEKTEGEFLEYFDETFGKGSLYDCTDALDCVQDSFYYGGNTNDAIDRLKENEIVDIRSKSLSVEAEITKHIRAVGRRVRSPMFNGHSRGELGISPDMSCANYFASQGKGALDRRPDRYDMFEEDDLDPVEQFRREAPKVGRNDPCPCGSGKKYKHCCGK